MTSPECAKQADAARAPHRSIEEQFTSYEALVQFRFLVSRWRHDQAAGSERAADGRASIRAMILAFMARPACHPEDALIKQFLLDEYTSNFRERGDDTVAAMAIAAIAMDRAALALADVMGRRTSSNSQRCSASRTETGKGPSRP